MTLVLESIDLEVFQRRAGRVDEIHLDRTLVAVSAEKLVASVVP
jgi:hypothetical protein